MFGCYTNSLSQKSTYIQKGCQVGIGLLECIPLAIGLIGYFGFFGKLAPKSTTGNAILIAGSAVTVGLFILDVVLISCCSKSRQIKSVVSKTPSHPVQKVPKEETETRNKRVRQDYYWKSSEPEKVYLKDVNGQEIAFDLVCRNQFGRYFLGRNQEYIYVDDSAKSLVEVDRNTCTFKGLLVARGGESVPLNKDWKFQLKQVQGERRLEMRIVFLYYDSGSSRYVRWGCSSMHEHKNISYQE